MTDFSKALLLGLSPKPKPAPNCDQCVYKGNYEETCDKCIGGNKFYNDQNEPVPFPDKEASLNENDNDCDGCAHEGTSARTCKICTENSNWEEKNCDNCLYENTEASDFPCKFCGDVDDYDKWKPK